MDEFRALARLAWPAIVGQLGIMGMGVVDLWVVRDLGKEATAAVGIGNTLSFGTLIVALGAVHGADGAIAQAFGGGRPGAAGTEAARVGLVALVLAIPVVLVHLLAEPLLRALGQPETVVPLAGTYVRIFAIGVLPAVGFQVVRQLLQGNGSVLPAMITILVANLVNLACDLLFVWGFGWGVAGAALSTTTVRFVMLAVLLWVARRELARAWPDGPVLDREALRRMAGLSLPVALQICLEVWAFNVGFFVAGVLGDAEAAAHTVAMNYASISFMLPLGISSAASTRVGNRIGAGDPWVRTAWAAVISGATVMSLSAGLFFAFPAALGRFYNSDPEVVALVAVVLPIAAVFQLFDGTQVVSFGVLRGLGDLRFPALFNIVGYWLVGLPLALLLVFRAELGLAGVWVGYSVALGIVAVLLVARLLVHTSRARRTA